MTIQKVNKTTIIVIVSIITVIATLLGGLYIYQKSTKNSSSQHFILPISVAQDVTKAYKNTIQALNKQSNNTKSSNKQYAIADLNHNHIPELVIISLKDDKPQQIEAYMYQPASKTHTQKISAISIPANTTHLLTYTTNTKKSIEHPDNNPLANGLFISNPENKTQQLTLTTNNTLKFTTPTVSASNKKQKNNSSENPTSVPVAFTTLPTNPLSSNEILDNIVDNANNSKQYEQQWQASSKQYTLSDIYGAILQQPEYMQAKDPSESLNNTKYKPVNYYISDITANGYPDLIVSNCPTNNEGPCLISTFTYKTAQHTIHRIDYNLSVSKLGNTKDNSITIIIGLHKSGQGLVGCIQYSGDITTADCQHRIIKNNHWESAEHSIENGYSLPKTYTNIQDAGLVSINPYDMNNLAPLKPLEKIKVTIDKPVIAPTGNYAIGENGILIQQIPINNSMIRINEIIVRGTVNHSDAYNISNQHTYLALQQPISVLGQSQNMGFDMMNLMTQYLWVSDNEFQPYMGKNVTAACSLGNSGSGSGSLDPNDDQSPVNANTPYYNCRVINQHN